MQLEHVWHDGAAHTAQDGRLRVCQKNDRPHIVGRGGQHQIRDLIEPGRPATEHVSRTGRHKDEADPVSPCLRSDLHHVGVRNSANLYVCHAA